MIGFTSCRGHLLRSDLHCARSRVSRDGRQRRDWQHLLVSPFASSSCSSCPPYVPPRTVELAPCHNGFGSPGQGWSPKATFSRRYARRRNLAADCDAVRDLVASGVAIPGDHKTRRSDHSAARSQGESSRRSLWSAAVRSSASEAGRPHRPCLAIGSQWWHGVVSPDRPLRDHSRSMSPCRRPPAYAANPARGFPRCAR